MLSFRALLGLCAAALLVVAGCKSPCRQLSEKLCECQANSLDKEACVKRAQQEESRVKPTDVQQQACEALLEGCDCHLIDTAEGKRACGLAR
jgi:hypothetical protein